MNTTAHPSQLKSRLILLLIVSLFFSSFFVAWGLRFAGWTPAAHKNFGELIEPPKDFSQTQFIKADGSPYPWEADKHVWRIVVMPDGKCQAACVKMMDTLQRVWETQGRQAARLEILWFGPLPAEAKQFNHFIVMQPSAALQAVVPEQASADQLPIYLMDYRGFLVMHYRAGFDPTGLRKDVARLLK
jgi:hypothetical protein